MTIETFQREVDGLINDFEGGATDGTEFRTGLLELLIKVAKSKLNDVCKNCKYWLIEDVDLVHKNLGVGSCSRIDGQTTHKHPYSYIDSGLNVEDENRLITSENFGCNLFEKKK